MDKYTIAYAPDDGYINMTVISMISVLENNPNKNIEFLILCSQLNTESMKKLEWLEQTRGCSVRYLKMNVHDFDGLPMSDWVTVQAWFRIKIPDMCPELSKVLYLDCDTMIVDDLEELFNTDLTDAYVGAVRDIWNVKKNVKRMGMKSPCYFNSGMLLINCEKFRNDNLFEKLKEYAKANAKRIKYCDQDTLNGVIDENKVELPMKFNYMEPWWRNYYDEYEGQDDKDFAEAKRNPIIVHLTGPKPTVKGCKNSMTGLWWKYAKLSHIYKELKEKYDASSEPVEKEKKMEKIFSIKNGHSYKKKWKIVNLLGFKINFK